MRLCKTDTSRTRTARRLSITCSSRLLVSAHRDSRVHCQLQLHTNLDMELVGWPKMHAIYLAWEVQGSFGYEPAHPRAHNNMLERHDSRVPRQKKEMLIIQNSTSGLFHRVHFFRDETNVFVVVFFFIHVFAQTSVAVDWHQSTSPPSTGERYGIRCPNSSRNSPLECTSFSRRTRSCACPVLVAHLD